MWKRTAKPVTRILCTYICTYRAIKRFELNNIKTGMLCSDFPYASPWILLHTNFETNWGGKFSVNFTLYEYVVFMIYSVPYTFFFYHVVHILLHPVLQWFYFRELVTLDFLSLFSIYVRYQTNSLCIYRNPVLALLCQWLLCHCSLFGNGCKLIISNSTTWILCKYNNSFYS